MKISSNSLFMNNNEKPTKFYNSPNSVYERDNNKNMPRICPAYFSPSFTAMKKSEFKGTDWLVVEKYKAPIQSFKTHDDFIDWTNKRCDEILKKDYTARSKEATKQRKAILKEWRNYLYVDNQEYSPAERLLILDNITKGLEKDNDAIPLTLDQDVLADTIYNLQKGLEADPNKKEYNFNKTYQKNLRLLFMWDEESSTGTDMTGWVVISSQKNDPDNIKTNIEKLKLFSHKDWCTAKTSKAKLALSKGDFHIYLDNGNPKLGIRFEGNEVKEIQGPKNDRVIPFQYFDVCKSYIDINQFKLRPDIDFAVRLGESFKEKYTPLINEIKESKTEEEIFEKLGIEAQRDKNGLLTLSHFGLPEEMEDDEITYEYLGINLNKLLKNVKEIKGDADFTRTRINSLPNLRKIGGNADFRDSRINDLSKLKEIGKIAIFLHAKIKNMSGLKTIGDFAGFCYAQIDDMSGLTTVGGNADFSNSTIKSDLNITEVGKDIILENAEIPNLNELLKRFNKESK